MLYAVQLSKRHGQGLLNQTAPLLFIIRCFVLHSQRNQTDEPFTSPGLCIPHDNGSCTSASAAKSPMRPTPAYTGISLFEACQCSTLMMLTTPKRFFSVCPPPDCAHNLTFQRPDRAMLSSLVIIQSEHHTPLAHHVGSSASLPFSPDSAIIEHYALLGLQKEFIYAKKCTLS